MSIHCDTSIYIMIFDISIQLKCVSIQYHHLMYHDMAIYRYIVASLVHIHAYCSKHKYMYIYYVGDTHVHVPHTDYISNGRFKYIPVVSYHVKSGCN